MKKILFSWVVLSIAFTAYASPVSLSDAGVTALTKDNIILNKDPIPNGGSIESFGIAIAPNGNVVVGWEDDNGGIQAAWMMLDKTGKLINKDALSYAGDDGKPISNLGGWGPKIHANLYGDGISFGSSYFDWIGSDDPTDKIPTYESLGSDDSPAVQLINNDGSFNGKIISAYPNDFVQRDGSIRIADAELLSNGNIVVIGEDRQSGDGPDLFELPNASQVVIAGIVKPDRTIVKAPVAVQQSDAKGEAWHGVATFTGGFGVRYSANGVKLRFFDNDLKPLTDEINVGDLDPNLNAGGRGDGAGWHGNGKGRFLLVGQLNGQVYAAVFDQMGKLVVGPVQADESDAAQGLGADRVDGAIDEAGNFVLAWRDQTLLDFAANTGVIAARFFNADGTPKTKSFLVTATASDKWLAEDSNPRVALHAGVAAMAWQDANTDALAKQEVAVRLFASPFAGTAVSHWDIME